MPSVGPGVVLLEERSDGQTVRVERGRQVYVFFGGCTSPPDFAAAVGGGPLFRESASADNPGGAISVFRAVANGKTTVTATRDAPCLHESPGCAVTAQVWQVTVEIVEPRPCEMTNAVTTGSTVTYSTGVPAGSTVRLHGRVLPNASVQVWFRPYGAQSFEARRQLVADADGAFATTFTPVVDQRWYATSGDCTTSPGLTVVLPLVSGPRYVTRGDAVSVVVHGPALQPVALYLRGPGGTFVLRRTGRLDADGTYRTSYVATTDERYYAVTGPDRRRSPAVLTQLR